MFPYEIKPVHGKNDELIKEHFKGKVTDFVTVGPNKWILPEKYGKHADKYYNFELRSDDVWIVTYMKSGTTLTQELVWMITNSLDYETSSKKPLLERCPFFEFNIMWNDEYKAYLADLNDNDPKIWEELKDIDTPCYEMAETMTTPRIFKTHLPPSLLPQTLTETCKVIYVARNPFDVAVSYYHHCKLITSYEYQSDFKKFWQLFEKDLLMYSPYWEHVKEGWANRQHPNFLFLFYEDLIRDMPGNIRKVATFLNKEMTHDEVTKLADHLHVDNFRKNVTVTKIWRTKGIFNPEAQGFIRRGKVGGNKEFDDEIKLEAEKWFKENLAKTDSYEMAETMISPRIFKTHLPPSLLPQTLTETCKVIYVARNPFDVAVSYYHHCKLITSHEYQSDFKKFWQFFEKDLLMYSPYWEHIKEGWTNRHRPNFLFLFYEDLVRDMPGNIRKVATFLNKEITHDEVMRLADHLHVDNFRKNVTVTRIQRTKGYFNPEAQGFIRRGKVGGNKEFDDEIKLKAEKWFKENLAKTDIKFPEF